ncbi:MAG: electron transfer flavoprotein subunit beta/FixA family protein [Candidatus Thermoplasmatota archaeon]|nr:electron transfer flavoprotein subunit beta/FixA family protein [Candidatus Thermoplasmatota archaeon]
MIYLTYNIIVLIKQILDIDQMKTNSTTGEPITDGVPMRVENLSKNAIEAAVRIKEKYGGKVTGIIFGGEQSSSAMKEAYAIGVDDGIVIKGYSGRNPALTAKVLSEKIKTLQYDMVILGNQSADTYTGLLPGKISSLLGIPLLGNAISIDPEEKEVKVTRVLEDHNVVLKGSYPVIISVSQEINEPRLPAVLQIIKAGKREIKIEKATVTDASSISVISDRAPKSERKKEIYEDQEKGIPVLTRVIKEAML